MYGQARSSFRLCGLDISVPGRDEADEECTVAAFTEYEDGRWSLLMTSTDEACDTWLEGTLQRGAGVA